MELSSCANGSGYVDDETRAALDRVHEAVNQRARELGGPLLQYVADAPPVATADSTVPRHYLGASRPSPMGPHMTMMV